MNQPRYNISAAIKPWTSGLLFFCLFLLPVILSAQQLELKSIGPFVIHETTGEDIYRLQEQGYSLTYVQTLKELNRAKTKLQDDSLAIFKIIPQTAKDTMELSAHEFSGSLSKYSTLFYIEKITLEGHTFRGITLLLTGNKLQSFAARSVDTDLTTMLEKRFGTPQITDEVLFVDCADPEQEKLQEGYVSLEWFSPTIIADFTIQYVPNKEKCSVKTSYYFTINDERVAARNYEASRKQYLRLKAKYGQPDKEEAKYHTLNTLSEN